MRGAYARGFGARLVRMEGIQFLLKQAVDDVSYIEDAERRGLIVTLKLKILYSSSCYKDIISLLMSELRGRSHSEQVSADLMELLSLFLGDDLDLAEEVAKLKEGEWDAVKSNSAAHLCASHLNDLLELLVDSRFPSLRYHALQLFSSLLYLRKHELEKSLLLNPVWPRVWQQVLADPKDEIRLLSIPVICELMEGQDIQTCFAFNDGFRYVNVCVYFSSHAHVMHHVQGSLFDPFE